MAAGLGFKTFNTGDVLSAADVNGYLMQGVLVFADATARDAAITSPQEGQFAYTKDTNGLWYYSGSAWVASGATGDIEGVTAGVGISGGGTSGTVTITNSMATEITASGDIIVGTGSGTFDNLPIGTTGQVLTADTTVSPYKVKWATPSSGSTFVGVQVTKTANTSVGAGANVQIPWDSEAFDTNGFHDNSTNNARLTVPSGQGGYYTVYFAMQWASSVTVARRIVAIYKNGNSSTGTFINNFETSSVNFPSCAMSFTMNLSAGDWIEIDAYQGTASALDFRSSNAIFGMEKIG